MQIAMFANEQKVDGRSKLQSALYNSYGELLEESCSLLQQQHYSAHELYEILIQKGYLKPTFFNEFQRFLRWAVREGYIDKSKIMSRTIRGKRLPNGFSKEQLLTYFHTCDNPLLAVASFIAIWSGLRIGDVVKIKIEDFDFEREILKVVQSKGSKDRVAPFLREGKPIIEKWIKYSGATEYLFPSDESHSMATIDEPYISKRTISNAFNKVVKEADLQRVDERYCSQENKRKKFTFHSFRHTFCTYHLENDTSIAFVSRAAGHEKLETTLGVYGHLATGNIVRAFRKSFEKKRKEKLPEKKKVGYNPLHDLAEKFVSGEINEEVFKMKKEALESVKF